MGEFRLAKAVYFASLNLSALNFNPLSWLLPECNISIQDWLGRNNVLVPLSFDRFMGIVDFLTKKKHGFETRSFQNFSNVMFH